MTFRHPLGETRCPLGEERGSGASSRNTLPIKAPRAERTDPEPEPLTWSWSWSWWGRPAGPREPRLTAGLIYQWNQTENNALLVVTASFLAFSDLRLSPWTPVEQRHMSTFAKTARGPHRTARLALCLQPPGKKMCSCVTFHLFGRRPKRGSLRGVRDREHWTHRLLREIELSIIWQRHDNISFSCFFLNFTR